jgi:hypothetical protein
MLATLLLQGRVAFFGVQGLIGFLIGLIVFIVIAVILMKILGLVLPKLGVDPTWTQVIYLICCLILFLIFLQVVGIWIWA